MSAIATSAMAAEESTPELVLEWQAPPECPSTADVKQSVARIVGDRPARTARARGVVRRDEGQFRVDLDVRQGAAHGRRSITASDCIIATDAAIVILATFIGEAPTPPPSAEPAAVVPPSSRVAETDAVPDVLLTRSRRFVPAAGVGVFVDSATLPAAAPGAVMTTALTWPHVRVQASAGGTLASEGLGRRTLDGRTLGVDANLWFGGLRGALHTTKGRLVVGAQAGADAGALHATGVGAWVPKTSDFFWFAIAAGPTMRLSLGPRFTVGGVVEALVPLTRPTLAIDAEAMHRPAPASLRALVMTEVSL